MRFAIVAFLVLGVLATGAAMDLSAPSRTRVPAIELRPSPLPEVAPPVLPTTPRPKTKPQNRPAARPPATSRRRRRRASRRPFPSRRRDAGSASDGAGEAAQGQRARRWRRDRCGAGTLGPLWRRRRRRDDARRAAPRRRRSLKSVRTTDGAAPAPVLRTGARRRGRRRRATTTRTKTTTTRTTTRRTMTTTAETTTETTARPAASREPGREPSSSASSRTSLARRELERLRWVPSSLRARIVAWFIGVLALATLSLVVVTHQVLSIRLDQRIDSDLTQEAAELRALTRADDPGRARTSRASDGIFYVYLGETSRRGTRRSSPSSRASPTSAAGRSSPTGSTPTPSSSPAWATLRDATARSASTPAGRVEYLAIPVKAGGVTGRRLRVRGLPRSREHRGAVRPGGRRRGRARCAPARLAARLAARGPRRPTRHGADDHGALDHGDAT